MGRRNITLNDPDPIRPSLSKACRPLFPPDIVGKYPFAAGEPSGKVASYDG
jgi:hypothetical protein